MCLCVRERGRGGGEKIVFFCFDQLYSSGSGDCGNYSPMHTDVWEDEKTLLSLNFVRLNSLTLLLLLLQKKNNNKKTRGGRGRYLEKRIFIAEG